MRLLTLIAIALLSSLAIAQSPFDVRLSGKIDGPHTIPPNNGFPSAVLCALYDPMASMLRIGLISRDGFVATEAKLYEVTPGGQRGNLVSDIRQQAGSPGVFFQFVSLNRLQENLLFNGNLYVEMFEPLTNVRIGGRVRAARKERLEAVAFSTAGTRCELSLDLYDPAEKLDVDVQIEAGSLGVGVELWTGTPASPGMSIGTVPGPAGGGPTDRFRSTISVARQHLDDLVNGNAFLAVDLTTGETVTAPITSELSHQIAFIEATQAGTTSQALAKLFVDPASDNTFEYSGGFTGITPTSIEIRQGLFGQSGPLVRTLPLVPGSNELSGSESFTPAEMDAFIRGEFYVQINSAAFPNGEIRGQLNGQVPDEVVIGDGCVGTNGLTPFLGVQDPFATVGLDSAFTITNAPANANAWLMVDINFPLSSPMDLRWIGMPNCFLFAGVTAVMAGTTDANGAVDFNLRAPFGVPALPVSAQGAVFDPGANALGATVTNALYIIVL